MSDIETVLLTSGSNVAPASSFNTDAIGPSANRLVLFALEVSWVASQATPPAVTVTFNGTGLTFEPITASGVEHWQDAATVNEWNALYLFRALGASTTPGTCTVASPVAMDDAAWSATEDVNVDTSGTHGAGAVVQVAENTGAGVNTLAVTLAAFSSPNNATYAAFGAGDADAVPRTFTPGSGFTELHDAGIAYAAVGTQWRSNNDTTVDTTLNSTASGVGGIAIEIKAGAFTGGTGGSPSDDRYRFRDSQLWSGGAALGIKRASWPIDALDFGLLDSIADNVSRNF